MMKPILQIIFPEGNRWFYVLSLIWFLAITIFLISFPALLVSSGYWYEHETGTVFDKDSDLMNLAEFLYGTAFEMWRVFALFLAVSCAFDMYYFYIAKCKEQEDWL